MIKLLLNHGAVINQEAAWGGSPYDYAKDNNLYEVIKIFEEYESSQNETQEYKESFQTLLLISKGLSIKYNNSEEIRVAELFNALHSVELSPQAEEVFREIFGDNMDQLNKDTDGYKLVELAKLHDKIKYDEQMKGLSQQLKESFGDDLILNIREPFVPTIDIDNDDIPF